MSEPHLYLLHGDDDFAAARFIQEKSVGAGDAMMMEMNTARLDGRTHSLDDLVQAANAMPFLASQRLVIFHHPLETAKSPAQQKRLLDILGRVPPTTRLILVVDGQLNLPKTKRGDAKYHWLEKWFVEAGSAAQVKLFKMPIGTELVKWIQEMARQTGGQFTPQGASRLADAIGPEPHILQAEIDKLLAYVNYARPVEPDDVHHVAISIAQAEDFALVNALRAHNAQHALRSLRMELEERDAIQVLSSITNQFRQLLLARDLLDQGGREEELVRALNIHPYTAKLAFEHARQFTLHELEGVYRRLIEMDEILKSSEMEADVALDTLVVQLSLR